MHAERTQMDANAPETAPVSSSAPKARRAPIPEGLLSFPKTMGGVTLSLPLGAEGARPVQLLVRPAPETLGPHTLTFRAADWLTAYVPACAGLRSIALDGKNLFVRKGNGASAEMDGPHLIALPEPMLSATKEVTVTVEVSAYERALRCAGKPEISIYAEANTHAFSGVATLTYPSPNGGERKAYVYLPMDEEDPFRHDTKLPLLVMPHPWNGSAGTYLHYRSLLHAAETFHVALLLPDGLGNSLYTAPAEHEVMAALDAVKQVIPIDVERVGIFGASMGGAGATTIGFHHPDQFSVVASFFGDSRYDRKTYVRSILTSDAEARAVNAADVAENGLHLRTRLLHGTEDKVSSPLQTTLFCDQLKKLKYSASCQLVPGGHEGRLVEEHIAEVVREVAEVHRPKAPERVIVHGVPVPRSTGLTTTAAYGVRVVPLEPAKEVYVEVVREGDRLQIIEARNVARLELSPGALGFSAIPTEATREGSKGNIPVVARP